MKNICALFIIDDNIASQLLKQEKEEISYQILHEEYFYRHLIDMQEFSNHTKLCENREEKPYFDDPLLAGNQ